MNERRSAPVFAISIVFLVAAVSDAEPVTTPSRQDATQPTAPEDADASAEESVRMHKTPPRAPGRYRDVHDPSEPFESHMLADARRSPDDFTKPWWTWEHATGDWFGLRPALADYGITLEPWIVMDASQNWRGGLNTNGGAFRHLFGVDLTIETEPFVGLKGGTFFVQYYNHNGPNATDEDAGDFQVFSNIDADGRSQVAELWYEQRLLDDRLRVKVGKLDANSEFDAVDHAGEFIHSSPGFSPTILSFPSYPDPAMSVNVFAYPTDWFYVGMGLYDGALQSGIFTGSRGPKTFIGEPNDLFWIAEAGGTWRLNEGTLDGRTGMGGWYHNGTFDRFNGDTQNGTEGFYFFIEQMLWRERPAEEDDAQGVGAFMMYGHADDDVAEADHHVGAGLTWTGAIPDRDNDVLGMGANWVHFSHANGADFADSYELAIEYFYKLQLTPFLSVKPDLQHIINPGGAGLGDAIVGTIRVEIVF